MNTPSEAPQVPEREIDFNGRPIWVKMPQPEQILVWQRTLKRLQDDDAQDWNGETVLAALERLRLIIDSVMLHRIDIDWLDDEMLAGRVTLQDTAAIVTKALEAFGEPGNRAERRAAAKAPVKRAARKAASTPRKAANR